MSVVMRKKMARLYEKGENIENVHHRRVFQLTQHFLTIKKTKIKSLKTVVVFTVERVVAHRKSSEVRILLFQPSSMLTLQLSLFCLTLILYYFNSVGLANYMPKYYCRYLTMSEVLDKNKAQQFEWKLKLSTDFTM